MMRIYSNIQVNIHKVMLKMLKFQTKRKKMNFCGKFFQHKHIFFLYKKKRFCIELFTTKKMHENSFLSTMTFTSENHSRDCFQTFSTILESNEETYINFLCIQIKTLMNHRLAYALIQNKNSVKNRIL